jgi:hypothetical protein
MYTWIRTVDAAQMPQALGWAHEVVSYVKSKIGLEGRVEIPTSGNPYRIRWIYQFESQDQHAQNTRKLVADPKYLELLKKGSDLFHPRTTCDETWTSA